MIRIVIIAAVSLLLLLFGQWMYNTYSIERALISDLIQKDYIAEANLKKHDKFIELWVELRNVENLKEVYSDLNQTTASHLKGKNYIIKFINEPDKLLEDVYNDKIQYLVYEAIQIGNFTNMKIELDKVKKQTGVDASIYIDKENIYIDLKHQDYFIYEVIGRQ